MPLEIAIRDKLLDLIRTKRAEVEQSTPVAPVGVKAVRRVAQLSDFHAVAELKRRHWLGEDSFENWERLWIRNPALRHWDAPPAIGWVLDAGSKIVGYLGSIPLAYWYRQRAVRAVTTHALVVDPEYRALTVGIVSAFLHQPGVDLFLNTTAVPSAAKLVMALGAIAVPQRDYGKVLFWVLNLKAFTSAVSRKLSLKQPWHILAGTFGPAAILAESTLQRRRFVQKQDGEFSISQIALDSIGDAFDGLWHQRRQHSRMLLAERSAEILRWHFSGARPSAKVRILVAYRKRSMAGYMALLSSLEEGTGLRRCIVADLFTEDEDSEVVKALVASAHATATADGEHVLEIVGFPEWVRKACLTGNPYSREYPACPFYFKTGDTDFTSDLTSESEWYASPYDGDGSLGW